MTHTEVLTQSEKHTRKNNKNTHTKKLLYSVCRRAGMERLTQAGFSLNMQKSNICIQYVITMKYQY